MREEVRDAHMCVMCWCVSKLLCHVLVCIEALLSCVGVYRSSGWFVSCLMCCGAQFICESMREEARDAQEIVMCEEARDAQEIVM